MNKYLIWGGAVVAVLGGILIFYPYQPAPVIPPPQPAPVPPVVVVPTPTPVPPPTPTPTYVPPDNGTVQPVVPLSSQADFVIDMTTVGFSPDNITIKKGDSIIWTNRDRAPHQIATAAISTYSDTGPTKAADSCGQIKLGQSCKITFTLVGTWKYYDRLNPQFTGSVIVQ